MNWCRASVRKLSFLVGLVGLCSMSVAHALSPAIISDEEIKRIVNTPVTVEQEALIDELLAVIFADVAPKSERQTSGGAFGVEFGQIFTEADGYVSAGQTITVSEPHALLTDYGVRVTPETHQTYAIGARAFFADQAACLLAHQAFVAELKSAYPASLVIYDDDEEGEFFLNTADAQIEVVCDYWEDQPDQQALWVEYVSDKLRQINRDEEMVNQINPNLQPLPERQSLQPLFGIAWNEPFENERRYPDNSVIRDITPPQADERFSHYEMGRGNLLFKPEYIFAKQDMADRAQCMQHVKDIEQTWHEQYPHSRWLREEEAERYGVKVIVRNGRLVASCFQPEEKDSEMPYRLLMLAYDNTFEDEGYVTRPIAYDAMRIISGELPVIYGKDGHHASYVRVRQIVEQYRQQQASE